MNIFDQFLNSISYKFDKGYPDMKNPNDIVLLKKSIVEVLGLTEEENYDDQILKLLAGLSDDEAKKKVITYLSKVNKKEDKNDDKLEENIIEHLLSKKLTKDIIDSILFKTIKTNQLQQFSNYLDNPTVTHSDLLDNNNLDSLFKNVPLNPNLKNQIINMDGAGENITFGKGEIALIAFLKGAKRFKSQEIKGDIEVENHILEVKRGSAILATASYISRATKSSLFSGGKAKEFIEKYNIDLKPKKTWISLITSVNAEDQEIKDLLKQFYPGLNINFDGVNMQNAEELNTAVGLALAKDYLPKKDLLFINYQNNYICIEDYNTFEQGVKSGIIKFDLASDIIPRCRMV